MPYIKRKLKRLLSKKNRKETRKSLNKINLEASILENQIDKKPMHYFSSETTQDSGYAAKADEDHPEKVIQGADFETDPEIMEVAFQHSAVLTKKGLEYSAVHTSLGDMNEEQEWKDWWEQQQYVELHEDELLKTDKVLASVGINNLRQKYR